MNIASSLNVIGNNDREIINITEGRWKTMKSLEEYCVRNCVI